MKPFAKLLAKVFVLVPLVSGCAGMQLHDWKVGVTLPYSESCFFVHALSGDEEEYPAAQCSELKKRSLIVTSEDWKILREDIQNSCQYTECRQLVGRFDGLFISIDEALDKVPLPGGHP